MDPLLHGILLLVALALLTLLGVVWFLRIEGWKRYIGIILVASVVSVLLLVVFAVMEG